MSREVWGRDECTQAPPQTPAGDSGPVDTVWPGHSPRSGLQVSSYGGTLRYELHSETQRGDVFIPTESRPDVVLQVADARVAAGRAGGHSRARAAGGPYMHVPASPGQPNEHHVPRAGVPGPWPRAPRAAAAHGGKWSWSGAQVCCAHSMMENVQEEDGARPKLTSLHCSDCP